MLGKDISVLHVAGTPAGVFDGFLAGFCVSGFVEWLLKSSLHPFLAQPLSCPAGAVHNSWASSSAAGTPWGLPWCHRGPVLPIPSAGALINIYQPSVVTFAIILRFIFQSFVPAGVLYHLTAVGAFGK